MLALKGTESPSWTELKALGPPEYETTRSVYQVIEVGSELQGYGTFEGLEAEHEYVIYVYLQDRGENQISAPGYVEFNTTGKLKIELFTDSNKFQIDMMLLSSS